MVVVCDDEDRENEGDLVMAAQFVTPEAINFMAKEARGWICLALTPERCDELGLELMTAKNESPLQTPFTVTIEARDGVTTGVSAHDRAHTMQVAIDPASGPDDLVQPGPRQPAEGQGRAGCSSAPATPRPASTSRASPGLIPAGVICEIMNDDGSMARVPDLADYCERHGLKMVTIKDLIAYRRRHDKLVERVVVDATLPTDVRRLRRRSATARWSTTSTTSRSSRARSPASPTCSCACTRSASPATSSTRCAATAASSSPRRCR